MNDNQFKMIPQFFSFFLLLTITALLFYPMFLELGGIYFVGNEYDSVFVIPLFSVYFLWIQKSKLRELNFNKQGVSYLGTALIFLLVGILLYIFGKYTYILFIQGIAFIIILAGAVLFIYGSDLFKITAIPIFFLIFVLPIPDPLYYAISEPLKYLIANMTAKAFSFLNIPVFIEGTIIHLPSCSFSVHDTCSGIRTTISLLAVAIGFAYLFLKFWHNKMTFIILSIFVGIFTNFFRVFIIGILSYFFNEDVGMTFHTNSSWFTIPFGIICIFLVGNIIRCREQKSV